MLDSSNPFAVKSSLPFGLVDFTQIRPEHYRQAFDVGMAQNLEEIDQIIAQTGEPTFENTIIPLELSGQLLNKALLYFFNDAGANTNDDIKAIQTEYSPKFASHDDDISLNEKLFERIETIYTKRDSLNLDPESLRILEHYYKEFVRSGAKLSVEDKEKLRAINNELAELTTAYGQNILSEMNDSAVVVDDVSELDGLDAEQIKAAADEAQARGLNGKYLITLKNTTIQPILKSLKNRALREKIYLASISRGMRGNAADNTQKAFRIAELRTLRANILGYPTYAAYSLDNKVARTVQAVNDMQNQLIEPSKASLAREAAELQALIDAENGGFTLAAHDWFYYAEKLENKNTILMIMHSSHILNSTMSYKMAFFMRQISFMV